MEIPERQRSNVFKSRIIQIGQQETSDFQKLSNPQAEKGRRQKAEGKRQKNKAPDTQQRVKTKG
jgi:hypothetical protein